MIRKLWGSKLTFSKVSARKKVPENCRWPFSCKNPLKIVNYTIFYMFENPRRGRQSRNFTTNVPKILDLKSSSEQIFSENWRWVARFGRLRAKIKCTCHKQTNLRNWTRLQSETHWQMFFYLDFRFYFEATGPNCFTRVCRPLWSTRSPRAALATKILISSLSPGIQSIKIGSNQVIFIDW